MKITILMENVPLRDGIIAEHGLGMYIESGDLQILMDTGQSPKTWINAQTLGIDPRVADLVVISHGHYDHAGGVMALDEMGCKAPVYMQKSAGGDFYSGGKYDGIDKRILDLPQVQLLEGNCQICEGASLFTGIKGRKLWPNGNYKLKIKIGEEYIQDDFRHEQCLLLEEDGKLYLFSGCAHNGILNIMEACREYAGRYPDYALSGFHMMKDGAYTEQEVADIKETASLLMETDTVFYTGHCTSLPAYEIMKELMGDQLQYMAAGQVIEI